MTDYPNNNSNFKTSWLADPLLLKADVWRPDVRLQAGRGGIEGRGGGG